MAITADSNDMAREGWGINGYSADWSGCEELVAAPGATSYLVLEAIAISCNSTITITIGEGETAGAVTTEVLGPIIFNAAVAGTFIHRFARPIRLAANKALVADGSGAGAATIYVEGYTAT